MHLCCQQQRACQLVQKNCGGDLRDGVTAVGSSPEPFRLILRRLLKSYQMVSISTHCYSWTNNEKNDMQTSQRCLGTVLSPLCSHISCLIITDASLIGRVCSQRSLRTTEYILLPTHLPTNSNAEEKNNYIQNDY